MNPLTQIKNTQKASQREIVEGIKGSWHDRYKHSGAWDPAGTVYCLLARLLPSDLPPAACCLPLHCRPLPLQPTSSRAGSPLS